jgi:hypothetical protein
MRQEVVSEPEDTEQLFSGTGAGWPILPSVRSAGELHPLKQEASACARGPFPRHKSAEINLPDLREESQPLLTLPIAILKFVTCLQGLELLTRHKCL